MSPTAWVLAWALAWALAWERQIILEIVRDAAPLQEVRDIADREGSIPYHATLEEWRNRLGISRHVLYNFYTKERSLLPETLESARIPRKP